MGERVRALWDVVRLAGVRFSADGATFLAQAVAFNAIFAALPLSLVVVALFGYIYGSEEGSARALDTIDRFAPQIYDLVSNNLPAVVQYRGISGTIGLIGLIWSSKNVFGAVSYGLDRALGVPTRHFLIETLIAVVLVPALAVVLVLATAVPLVLTYVAHSTALAHLHVLTQLGSYLFSIAFVFAVVAAIYTYLPNRRPTPGFGIPGATVTALGYAILQVGFGIYAAHANVFQIYGTLSTILAVMFWVYLACMVFLYGAHVSAQWEERFAAAPAAAVGAATSLAS